MIVLLLFFVILYFIINALLLPGWMAFFKLKILCFSNFRFKFGSFFVKWFTNYDSLCNYIFECNFPTFVIFLFELFNSSLFTEI